MDNIGQNITKIPTSEIQKNLGGLAVDNKYGPKTTEAVKNFQSQSGITVDGIFGPETEKAYNAKYNTTTDPSLITTSGDARNKFTQNSAALNNALKLYNISSNTTDTKNKTAEDVYKDAGIDETAGTDTDPYMKMLDSLSARSSAATQNLISTIKAKSQQQKEKVNTLYNDYTSGLQLLGIQSNSSKVTPDIVANNITQAKSEQISKISQLDSEEASALVEAETARDNNDFKTLNDKMEYVKDIRKQKAQALKDYNDSLKDNSEQQVKDNQTAKAISHDIYDTLSELNDSDKEDFIIAIAQKFNLPVLSIVSALTDVENDRKKNNKEDALLSPSEAATLGVSYGTTKAEAAKMGITPARYKPEKSSSTDTIKEATDEITKALKTGIDADGNKVGNAKGSDGYADPGVYIKYFNAWPGTDKEFLAKFPVKTYVNPKSYGILPASIKPKDDDLANQINSAFE